jgi:hypothetical protein
VAMFYQLPNADGQHPDCFIGLARHFTRVLRLRDDVAWKTNSNVMYDPWMGPRMRLVSAIVRGTRDCSLLSPDSEQVKTICGHHGNVGESAGCVPGVCLGFGQNSTQGVQRLRRSVSKASPWWLQMHMVLFDGLLFATLEVDTQGSVFRQALA